MQSAVEGRAKGLEKRPFFICSDLVTFLMPNHANKTMRQIIVLWFQLFKMGMMGSTGLLKIPERIGVILTRILFLRLRTGSMCVGNLGELASLVETTTATVTIDDLSSKSDILAL